MSLELSRLNVSDAEDFLPMTFPVYRHMLSLEPQTRHPEQGDQRLVRPIAIGAHMDGEPIGLALGEVPLAAEGSPELLSLYVAPHVRGQGTATSLIEAFEDAVRSDGYDRVLAVYMTGRAGSAAVERIFEKRRWSAPEARTVTLRFTPDQALATPWFGRKSPAQRDFELFPWTELTAEERTRLQESQRAAVWIPQGLEPWRHDAHGFDATSSIGMRHKGEVIGWVINHRVSDDLVRFTCSFVRRGLGNQGWILPLYSASIEKLRAVGCKECMFVTPVGYHTMVAFVKRRCAPWASFYGETRGCTKSLGEGGAM
ncbi:MAG TPA: GNAT family N-acetyltransferase [Candidatus Polarisedimenticolaceae bacterium]|nr:GNAT family N-acetyltransferase [Candidatus Polarisedimenticolaceae bacterium]